MSNKQQQPQYIVVFPFMAQGHIIPFLALAKLILKRYPTYTIAFVSTPLNIHDLHSSLPPDSNINLHPIPFGSTEHGLPPGVENTDALSSPSQWIQLFQASTTLKFGFARLISDLTREHGQPPLLVVADVLVGWTVEISKELNIFHACFTTCGAYGSATISSLWRHLPHIHMTNLQEFSLPDFPESFKISRSQLSAYLKAANGTDPFSIFFVGQISHSLKSNVMLINTVEEVEIQGLRVMRRQSSGLKVLAIGPLLPFDSNSSEGRSRRKAGGMEVIIMKWLDLHHPSSVVYVSFGSQNSISPSQMMSLANGLEASGLLELIFAVFRAGFRQAPATGGTGK